MGGGGRRCRQPQYPSCQQQQQQQQSSPPCQLSLVVVAPPLPCQLQGHGMRWGSKLQQRPPMANGCSSSMIGDVSSSSGLCWPRFRQSLCTCKCQYVCVVVVVVVVVVVGGWVGMF